jgi:hypothetical protein
MAAGLLLVMAVTLLRDTLRILRDQRVFSTSDSEVENMMLSSRHALPWKGFEAVTDVVESSDRLVRFPRESSNLAINAREVSRSVDLIGAELLEWGVLEGDSSLDPAITLGVEGYIEHPRYGRHPRITGLNPLHLSRSQIPLTAIVADISRQVPNAVGVQRRYYVDEDTKCGACGKRFIFFAEEQKYWYEELQFNLEVSCRYCPICRKVRQSLAAKKKRYEELIHVPARSVEQNLETAECYLALVEAQVFLGTKAYERARTLLNLVPEERRGDPRYADLVKRTENLR